MVIPKAILFSCGAVSLATATVLAIFREYLCHGKAFAGLLERYFGK